MFALEYNGNVTEMSVVRSDYAVEKNLYPGDAIKWAIIKWGHGQGFRTYDLAGVNPNPETPKEQGIRQFKEKWGGEYVEYPIFTKRT
jgi:lipid II:glycine glycyltransferase (peptidoglycan interpeptide bridge formation enzyme)